MVESNIDIVIIYINTKNIIDLGRFYRRSFEFWMYLKEKEY